MAETVVELGVETEAQEAVFVQALDDFARWREATCGTGWLERDAPDLMVKTVCSADGELKKAVIFQDQSWAETFIDLWTAGCNAIA